MEIKKFIRKVLTDMCVLFTVLVAVWSVGVLIFNYGDEEYLIEVTRVILFAVFSLVSSVVNNLLRVFKVHTAVRHIIRYPILAVFFYLCFMLQLNPSPSNTFVGLSAFTLVYVILVALAAFFRSRYKSVSNESSEYTKKFSAK